uniref:ATP-dependent DNA helicase n=1 Tax=Tanacetum cinerariifolium TaxID=118510 RepID=A0A699HJ90_TANCI|nr:DNA helicase [Tanacetum cinerariifolium]
MVAILEKSEHNVDFHPIVDFVEASPLRIEITEEGTKILTTVYGILRTVTESSLRRNLKLKDEEGISSLLDVEHFENLTLIGYNISPNQKFTFQKGTPTEPHHTPSLEAQQTSSTTHSSPTLPPVITALIPTVTPSDTPHLKATVRLVTKFEAQELEINRLKARVKLLEDREGVVAEQSGDDSLIKGRNLDEGEATFEKVSDDKKAMATVLTLMDAASILTSGGVQVVPTAAKVATATVSILASSDVVSTASPNFATATVLEEEMERDAQRMNEQNARDVEVTRIHAEEEQKRDYYMAIIKSNLGWKVKDFRGMTFEEIEAKFTTAWKQIENFIPMGSKKEVERFKRKGIRFKQESMKKLKTSEEVLEGNIIRLGGSSASYKFFVDLLKHLDREHFNQLWALVKESLNIRATLSDKEMELWVELKRLYEPDVEDQLEGFPLRKGLAIVMISYKLQVENYSHMANDLILKIYKIANCPIIEFPLPGEVPTASEESSHCQKKREATTVKIALLLKSRRNCQSKSNDSYAKAERVSDDTEEMATVLTSIDAASILTSGGVQVVPTATEVATATNELHVVVHRVFLAFTLSIPAGSDVVPTASPNFATATVVTPYTRRKEVARIHAEEELQMMISNLDRSNETVLKYLQEYEQFAKDLSIRERVELINDLIKYQENYAQILKYQTHQRKPWSKKQKRDYYTAIIKSNLGWKVKDFRGMTFEEIEAKFTTVRKQIKNCIPMSSKEETERFKKKGIRFEQESVKKLKTSEEVKASEEVPKEKVKEMMQLVPIEEVYVEALQVKHPIFDWKVHTEEQRNYWKIIRLGGSSASYQFFVDLLKNLDREDLNQLWALVKESLNIRPASIEWKLYDSCGVHHVTSKDNEIFMLIEKDYPLRKGLAIMMINYKLQVEKYSQMANDLILKIYKIANCPSIYDVIIRGDRDGSDLRLRTVLTASFTREIEEFIEQFPQLTIADRADIVDHVFKKKVRDYTYFVRNSNTFGDVTSVLYTIEFQKRGLPHCHSLLWISASSKVQQDIDVDKYVFAELPDPITDATGYAVVSELMLHGPCGALNMNASCMKDGDLFYERMLLCHHKGCRSFAEIRTLNGTTYPTNKAACQALGLLVADEEWIEAFQEAALSATTLELRKLFVHILSFCNVADPMNLWQQLWKHMTDDIPRRLSKTLHIPEIEKNEKKLKATILLNLEAMLSSYSKTLKDFGLPPPPEDMIPILQNRFLMETTNYDLERLLEERNFLIPKLNEDEKLIFNEVTSAVKANIQKLIFVYGHGGTGKTFMWKAITSALRSEEKNYARCCIVRISNIYINTTHEASATRNDERKKAHIEGFSSWLLKIGDGTIAIPHGNDGGETELLYPTEYLNSLKFAGLPPHRMELKVALQLNATSAPHYYLNPDLP